jgi:hypothetical protein
MNNSKLVFAFLASALSFASCMHPQNQAPEYIIKNDGYTKAGSHGYNPNFEKPKEEASSFSAKASSIAHDSTSHTTTATPPQEAAHQETPAHNSGTEHGHGH